MSRGNKKRTIMEFIIVLVYIAVVVFIVAAYWKIFTKAGKPGWACLIPIYNIIVLLEIVGKPWWWLLLMLIPVVNLVFAIWMTNLLSKSFGKSEGFTVGLILLPIVFYPILGFGDAKYQGPAGQPQPMQ
jgi:uncharacterized membrane protein YhaH (DUF805 family)